MNRHVLRFSTLAALVVGCLLAPRFGDAKQVTATDAALQPFQHNVAAYLALRARVTAALPEHAVTPDPGTLQQTTTDLARAIARARQHVRRGNVFTAEVADRFRRIISTTLRQHGISPTDVLAELSRDLNEGTLSGQRPTVDINVRFPWSAGSSVPPAILAALPALPTPLRYTFVMQELVLVDADADLVVDILPDALQGQ